METTPDHAGGESPNPVRQKTNVAEGNFRSLPVTVLSGFLGSGKTTLLKHILSGNHGLKIAVIVNDMAPLNIDGDRVGTLIQTESKMVEMQNGCICCTLREDLLLEIKALALEGKFDYLVIESTGISEPLPVAETFSFGVIDETENESKEHVHSHSEEHNHHIEHPQHAKTLNDVARLDTMVTVMDAKQFLHYLQCDETLFEKWGEKEEVAPEEERTVSYLLFEQLEFANVILLNKIDLVSPEELKKVNAMVQKINPDAKVFHTKYSAIDLNEIINTNLFSFEKASFSAGWLKELRGEHIPESEEYGISSFILEYRKPLDAMRFHEMLETGELQKGIIRAKGVLWLEVCHDLQIEFDICGATISLETDNSWLAATPEEEWNFPLNDVDIVKKLFCGPYGDRRCEVVCIGDALNEVEIRKRFEMCFLPEEEFNLGPESWAKKYNPFELDDEEETEELVNLENTISTLDEMIAFVQEVIEDC